MTEGHPTGHPGGHPHGAPSQNKKEATLRLVAWETTRACNLACKHCRAAAVNKPYEGELDTQAAFRLMDQIAEVGQPIVILTGGEPLLREDIFDIARYGTDKGLRMVMAPNGTLITPQIAEKMAASGIRRISASIDGATKEFHDKFRGVDGAFDAAIRGIEYVKAAGIEFQINTTITKTNLDQIPRILELAEELGAVAHHIFLLVPTGRGKYIVDQASAGVTDNYWILVAALIVTLAHQQCSTGRPRVIAHWLSPPHSGQIFSSDSVSKLGPSLFLDVAL